MLEIRIMNLRTVLTKAVDDKRIMFQFNRN